MLRSLNRNPVLFEGKSFHLVYFGLFAALAAFAYALLFLMYLDAKGVTPTHPFLALLTIAAPMIVGAKVLPFAAAGADFLRNPRRYLRQTSYFQHGGFIGAAVGCFWLSHVAGIPPWILFDGVAYGGALSLAIGRLGCYNYGCCHGVPVGDEPNVVYTHPQSKVVRLMPHWRGVPLAPTQLISAAFNLSLFLAISVAAPRFPRDGMVAAAFLIAQSTFRLVLDPYRHQDYHGVSRFPRIMAAMYLCTGIILMALLSNWGHWVAWRHGLGPCDFLNWARETPDAAIAALLVGLPCFVVYGYHGRTLGTFR
jgi:prolipoprotein diacylglyceryltransferase